MVQHSCPALGQNGLAFILLPPSVIGCGLLCVQTLKEDTEEGFLLTLFPAVETSTFLKGDLGGTSQSPPQLVE